jgi:hypothetical protein
LERAHEAGLDTSAPEQGAKQLCAYIAGALELLGRFEEVGFLVDSLSIVWWFVLRIVS